MAKILNIHPLELKSGVDVQEFEKFVTEELSLFVWHKGSSSRVLKGIKGSEKDQYILVFDQDREFYFLPEKEGSEIHRRHNEANPENSKLVEKLLTYVVNPFEDGRYTHFNELD